MFASSLPFTVRTYRYYMHSKQIKITNISRWTFFKDRISLQRSSLPAKICYPIPTVIGKCGYFTFRIGHNVKLLRKVFDIKILPKRNIHPAVWIFARPIFKLMAVITGKVFRKWWKDLPPNKKKYFLGQLQKNKLKIGGGISFLALLALYYYLSHVQETPVTKRKRFIAFTAEQFKQLGDIEFKKILQEFQPLFLPQNHPSARNVETVVNKLLAANTDIKEIYGKDWLVAVVNNDTENAFVLPNGQIFVFCGMLKLCSNNDQLGTLLAHEMSHCILHHAAEKHSLVHLVDFAMIIVITAIWAILPRDILALVTHWFFQQIVDIMLHLPYNRKIETEADEVGLKLSAKACFDVRESSAFWSKIAVLKRAYSKGNLDEILQIEFLSTHPSHEKRSQHLDTLMNQALKLRMECGCYNLKTPDPRIRVEILGKMLDEEKQKQRARKSLSLIS